MGSTLLSSTSCSQPDLSVIVEGGSEKETVEAGSVDDLLFLLKPGINPAVSNFNRKNSLQEKSCSVPNKLDVVSEDNNGKSPGSKWSLQKCHLVKLLKMPLKAARLAAGLASLKRWKNYYDLTTEVMGSSLSISKNNGSVILLGSGGYCKSFESCVSSNGSNDNQWGGSSSSAFQNCIRKLEFDV